MSENPCSILFICDHAMSLVGGSQESLKVIMSGIKGQMRISLFTPGTTAYGDDGFSHYHYSKYDSMKRMIRHPLHFIAYFLLLLNNIRKNKYQIIHTQEQVGYFAVAFFKRMRLIPRETILIHTERGLREKYGSIIRFIFDRSLKYTNVLVTTTHYNLDAWKKAVESRRATANVSCELIENTAGELYEQYDESKRIAHDDLRIGFAGRYCEWKGWDFAEAICNSLADNPRISITIVMGCLTERDLKETERLFSRLKKTLSDRFSGHINYSMEQMNDFYYQIDIFALTSKPHSESFGRVLVEAMSRKAVVLTTDCGGATEVVGKKENICPTIGAFVKRINELAHDNALLRKEQNEALQRFQQNYNLENNVEKHKRLYQRVLRGESLKSRNENDGTRIL